MNREGRDHGGGIDAACQRFGGARSEWLDLSTGINPVPYPLPRLSDDLWTSLPDQAAFARLIAAARKFWDVPAGAGVVISPGLSSVIACLPDILAGDRIHIPGPTYNEYAAAFDRAGWKQSADADTMIAVHPNNPDGRYWARAALAGLRQVVIDESFLDLDPDRGLIDLASRHGHLILKSFGKFWGLAGLRLGFAIGDPALCRKLSGRLGPWQVSGPALEIGRVALEDTPWAGETRQRLRRDGARLTDMMRTLPLARIGGTDLFHLYQGNGAAQIHTTLAEHHIWTRIFPYAPDWIRLGLPGDQEAWDRLEKALDQVS